MRRIFAIWALCLCWGVLNAAPLGPFNATLLEKLKTDYQKGDKEVFLFGTYCIMRILVFMRCCLNQEMVSEKRNGGWKWNRTQG